MLSRTGAQSSLESPSSLSISQVTWLWSVHLPYSAGSHAKSRSTTMQAPMGPVTCCHRLAPAPLNFATAGRQALTALLSTKPGEKTKESH